jgi:hypothetical protein
MKKGLFLIFALTMIGLSAYSQRKVVFEEPKNVQDFNGVKVKVGGDFALQFQGLSHTADSALIALGSGFNLPTANFSITGQLAKGVKVYLNTFLSARHHNESWVEGGYLQMDELPFFNSPMVDKWMQNLTLKFGFMELNYGDAHFRRTNNGRALYSPFVGNLIMDAYTTTPSLEVLWRKNGIIAMVAATGGALKPALGAYNSTTKTYSEYNFFDELAVYGKIGYDKEVNQDLRLRATFSYYANKKNHGGTLFAGDRSGSRYYLVMNKQTKTSADYDITANAFLQNWGPGSTDKNNAMMLNIYGKYKGFELFGTYENAKATSPSDVLTATKTEKSELNFTQIAIEGLYYFGKSEQFFVGARYNKVTDKSGGTDTFLNKDNTIKTDNKSVDRIQVGGGWYMTENMVAKLEYVNQNFNNFNKWGNNAGFKGIMFEAAISF